MITQAGFSAESVSAPAFAQRVALSVLALEIDELLHRSGAQRPTRPDTLSAPTQTTSENPQTHYSS